MADAERSRVQLVMEVREDTPVTARVLAGFQLVVVRFGEACPVVLECDSAGVAKLRSALDEVGQQLAAMVLDLPEPRR